ncbi:hypothetical protein WJX84_006481 [Apatococcus fuscideae]|uniref:AAA+ ATPase domain-containing protein n=1 Tax=Apatococcus fuscideae TaxID=2026836 RepID=A0AAW1TH08_9CHLO
MNSSFRAPVDNRRAPSLLRELFFFGLSLGVSAWALRYVISQLDPSKRDREKHKAHLRKVQETFPDRNIGHPTEYELALMHCVIHPQLLDTTMDQIGGHQDIKKGLRQSVLWPIQLPGVFRGTFGAAPKGVLLYGPPGTGKTMLAQALAKESGAVFINVKPSTLLDKYLGVSNKLVAALWMLARRLQPSIIYIDEADAMFATRNESGHEAMAQMKTEFMQLWDGLVKYGDASIVVLAATNMLSAIDPAIQRRFTVSFEVGPPDAEQRRDILRKKLLRHQEEFPNGCEPTLLHSDMQELVDLTPNYTGSDLHNLCQHAMQAPMQEFAEQLATRSIADGVPLTEANLELAGLPALRAAHLEDFRRAHAAHPPCSIQAENYNPQDALHGLRGTNLDLTWLHQLAVLVAAILENSRRNGGNNGGNGPQSPERAAAIQGYSMRHDSGGFPES